MHALCPAFLSVLFRIRKVLLNDAGLAPLLSSKLTLRTVQVIVIGERLMHIRCTAPVHTLVEYATAKWRSLDDAGDIVSRPDSRTSGNIFAAPVATTFCTLRSRVHLRVHDLAASPRSQTADLSRIHPARTRCPRSANCVSDGVFWYAYLRFLFASLCAGRLVIYVDGAFSAFLADGLSQRNSPFPLKTWRFTCQGAESLQPRARAEVGASYTSLEADR